MHQNPEPANRAKRTPRLDQREARLARRLDRQRSLTRQRQREERRAAA